MFGIFERMDLLQPTSGAGISPERRTIGAASPAKKTTKDERLKTKQLQTFLPGAASTDSFGLCP